MGRHHKGYLAAVRCSPDPLLPLLFQKSECLFVLPLRSPLPAILVCKSQNFNNTIFSTGRLKNFPQNNTRFNIARKRLRGPAGPRRLRNSDAHKRIAVPQAFCVFGEHIQPRPQNGKVCRSDTRPGDVRERAVRVEDNDSAPSEMPPVSPCKPLCAIL